MAKLQQNWNELTLYRKTAGLAPTEEESVVFLAKEKKKRSKRVAQSVITSTKRGHKKAMAEPASIPVEMAIPLEEQIHDQAPPPSPQTLHKKNTVQKKPRIQTCLHKPFRSWKSHVPCFQGPPGSPHWVGLTSGTCGMIADSIFKNKIVVSILAAWGSVIKRWNDFKKFPIKVGMCQFAYTTYAKTLTKLRNHVRGIPFEEDSFLIKMQSFDDTITNFSPPTSDERTQKYYRRFRYAAMEGMCFVDGCPRQPMLNTSHIPLKDKKAKTSCVKWCCMLLWKKARHTWGDKWLGYDVYQWTPNTLKKF